MAKKKGIAAKSAKKYEKISRMKSEVSRLSAQGPRSSLRPALGDSYLALFCDVCALS
jgi:hypothetical protein